MRGIFLVGLALALTDCSGSKSAPKQVRMTDGPPTYLALARKDNYVLKTGATLCATPELAEIFRAWRTWAAAHPKTGVARAAEEEVNKYEAQHGCYTLTPSTYPEAVRVDFYQDIAWGFIPADSPGLGGVNKVARVRTPLPPVFQIPRPHEPFFPMPLYGIAYVDTRDLQPARPGIPPLPVQ